MLTYEKEFKINGSASEQKKCIINLIKSSQNFDNSGGFRNRILDINRKKV